ncbi:MAG: glycoside hydrolase family 25 [Ruminococcus sp.]|nr:glycoside hydrolase family 25 [Ruminococcus sp.]
MKRVLFGIMAVSACVLAGCTGEKVGLNSQPPQVVETSTTAVSTTTQTITTTVTTTAAKEAGELPDGVRLDLKTDLEVYEETTARDLVLYCDGELLEPDTVINTDDLGEKEAVLKFGLDGEIYTKKVKYTVSDTTPPLCLNSGWEPYAKAGEPFDLDKIVGFVDNYDRAPELSFSGDVDTSEVGAYPITVYVTDSSGNETSWDMTVLVMNEIPKPADDNPRVDYQDFIDRYNYENVRYGIDVSAWQTNVDYEAVREAGCEFVIMRMGYYYTSYDAPRMDDYYLQNMENATAAGLDVGVYLYTSDNTEEGVREHARWVVEQLGGRELDFPIAFDWEEWGHFQEYGMNIRDLNELFEAFSDELEKNGYSAMLYSSKNFLNSFWENKNGRPVWLAHFVDETDYTGPYNIWQESAYGRIPGIEGDVDMNIQFMDRPFE